MREKKPMKIPYNINFISNLYDFEMKISIIKDISQFIRENQGRQISIVLSLEIKK